MPWRWVQAFPRPPPLAFPGSDLVSGSSWGVGGGKGQGRGPATQIPCYMDLTPVGMSHARTPPLMAPLPSWKEFWSCQKSSVQVLAMLLGAARPWANFFPTRNLSFFIYDLRKTTSSDLDFAGLSWQLS